MKVKDILGGASLLFASRGYKLVDSLDEADIVVLNGGEDIATEIYGQEPITAGYGSPRTKSHRDKMEILCYERAVAQGKFVFGICRGAQLANCLNGGTLWQHITNHGYAHDIVDLRTGKIYNASSLHHQEMIPPEGAEILAVANRAACKYDKDDQLVSFTPADNALLEGKDVEVVWFPKTRTLGIQGHPEYMPRSDFADYCFELVDSLYHEGVWPASQKATG